MEVHRAALRSTCRVCIHRINFKETNCTVEDSIKEIGQIWGIEAIKDQPDIHPSHICHRCYRKVKHIRNGTRAYSRSSEFQQFQFYKHNRTGTCLTCEKFLKSKNGSQANPTVNKKRTRTTASVPKPKPKNLPFSLTDSDIFFHLHNNKSSSDYRLEINSKSLPQNQHQFFICSICLCIISNPVQSNCQHLFCSDCLTKLFQNYKDFSVPCPVCFSQICYHSVRFCPNILLTQLFSLAVFCSLCWAKGTLAQLANHECSTIITCTSSDSSPSWPSNHLSSSSSSSLCTSPIMHAANTLKTLTQNHTPYILRAKTKTRCTEICSVRVEGFIKGTFLICYMFV